MEDLRPCPFCGSKQVEYRPAFFGDGESHGVAMCLECGCTVPTSEFGRHINKPYSAWNRREQDKLAANYEAIKKAADALLEESRAFGKAIEELGRFLLAKEV